MIPYKDLFRGSENALASLSFGATLLALQNLGMPKVYWAFVVFIVLDVLTGILAGAVNGVLESSAGWKGIYRKSIAVGIVLTFALLEALLKEKTSDYQIPAGELVASLFCFQEIISITENAVRAGVWVPGIVKSTLKRLKTVVDMEETTHTQVKQTTETKQVVTQTTTETSPPIPEVKENPE